MEVVQVGVQVAEAKAQVVEVAPKEVEVVKVVEVVQVAKVQAPSHLYLT